MSPSWRLRIPTPAMFQAIVVWFRLSLDIDASYGAHSCVCPAPAYSLTPVAGLEVMSEILEVDVEVGGG